MTLIVIWQVAAIAISRSAEPDCDISLLYHNAQHTNSMTEFRQNVRFEKPLYHHHEQNRGDQQNQRRD